MNDGLNNLNELERRLERAAASDAAEAQARQLPTGDRSENDPEAAGWREAWRAWEKMLKTAEAANPPDEAVFERLLAIPTLPEPEVPDLRVQPAPVESTPSSRIWRNSKLEKWLGVAVTVAATLLFLELCWVRYGTGGHQRGKVEPVGPLITQRIAPNQLAAPGKNGTDELNWNDDFDSRMASLEEQVHLAQYDSLSLGGSFDSTRVRLQNLSEELDKNPL
jgi:hypothetical protein